MTPPALDAADWEWPSATRYARHLASFYDAVTGAYDDWSSGVHRRVAARLVEIASPVPGERVLDVGCGTGLVTQMAAEWVGASGEVIGVDIAGRLLEVARRRASPRVRFLHVPAEALVFSDLTFDVVTVGDALPYLADPVRALSEARRVLRRGARIAVSVLDRALDTPAQAVYQELLLALERRHPIAVPRPPGDRSRFGEPEVVGRLLGAAGFTNVVTTMMVTGGRVTTAREWTDLMMGSGPSSHALLSVLGPAIRQGFEAELTERMSELGEDEAFRYHHPFTFAAAVRS
ncbi:MAG TPA: methyltransferase domain-containing protein [Candidatus Binatia bacterium]|nr:methyltransferase domain-containing protein [Candidatus Binatia bacterium]